MVRNIIIGFPIVNPETLLGTDWDDFYKNEYPDTFYTHDRRLAHVLVKAGIAPTVSEVRRNKPELVKTFGLRETDCFWVKWGKKKIYVIVGMTSSTDALVTKIQNY